jgi:hypothetical protein
MKKPVRKRASKRLVKKLKPSATGSITRQKVYIDTEILSTACQHLSNKATFAPFKGKGDPSIVPEDLAKKHPGEMTNWVCFSGLTDRLARGEANRLYDKLEIMTAASAGRGGKFLLDAKGRSDWLSLAKKHNLLPPYINENAIIDVPKNKQKSVRFEGESTTAAAMGEFIINLEGLSPAVLYVYLSTLRNLREDPGLPRAVLYLVNELGMNFYAAYVFASQVVMNTTGHHIINEHRHYGMVKNVYDRETGQYICDPIDQETLVKTVLVDLKTPIGIQRLVNSDPLKYDTRSCSKGFNSSKNYGFCCEKTISGISKVTYTVNFQQLFDKDIVAAIMSKNDGEAREFIDKFEKRKTSIKYKEAAK